jgi:hypothetical protein
MTMDTSGEEAWLSRRLDRGLAHSVACVAGCGAWVVLDSGEAKDFNRGVGMVAALACLAAPLLLIL